MKALILALGIASVALPVVAQGNCSQGNRFYSTCTDYYGNQYSVQTFGPTTFVNGINVHYSRRFDNRPGYHTRDRHHKYSFGNYQDQKNTSWPYLRYISQPVEAQSQLTTAIPLSSFSTYWERNPWERPSHHQPNIYLRRN
ncbi:hypothetical protein NIES970_19780 [[Synechococcus] sp. NIES-970]|nr:hypothetical protein NIES970_19780 [[Synechococcus] sp. NIES-970]